MADTLPSPRRRFLRFTLRTLLLLVLLVGATVGWSLHKAREHDRAVAALEELGFTVEYADGSGSPTVLERLRTLLGEAEPRNAIGVDGNWLQTLPNAGLIHLELLPELTQLDLKGRQVTDAGLPHLQGLNRLETLYLNGHVTDGGVVYLSGLTRLEMLGLTRMQISDAGLVHLKGLSRLKCLFLGETQVTDDGLVHLKGMTTLEWLSLEGTHATDSGVKKLQLALPKCRIDH